MKNTESKSWRMCMRTHRFPHIIKMSVLQWDLASRLSYKGTSPDCLYNYVTISFF